MLGGDVYFGLAESCQIRYLAAAIKKYKSVCPGMRYHITSGDTEQVTEKLDRGLLDFAVLAEEPNAAKYHSLAFPETDLWGVVMPSDCPLAQKEAVRAEDLIGLPLFCSEQGWNHDIPRWCGPLAEELRLEGSFRLSYNGSLFVKEGLGYLSHPGPPDRHRRKKRACLPPAHSETGNQNPPDLEKTSGLHARR